MKKLKKFKKLKNKIKGLSIELDKANTKLSDLDPETELPSSLVLTE
jgi:hypothetical protein